MYRLNRLPILARSEGQVAAPRTTVLVAMDCVFVLSVLCYVAAARLIAKEQRER
jgi:hypothetical protein